MKNDHKAQDQDEAKRLIRRRPCIIHGTIYENVEQNLICITEDRAKLYVNEWKQKIKAQGSWQRHLYQAAGFLVALLTADADKFTVAKEYWSALFVVCLLFELIQLIRSIKRRRCSPAESTDQIVEKLMRGQLQVCRPS
jgi:hypothetical protein